MYKLHVEMIILGLYRPQPLKRKEWEVLDGSGARILILISFRGALGIGLNPI